MKIVTVIPLQKGAFIDDLTYFTAKEIKAGAIVTVPLRNKKILGLVILVEDLSDSKGDIKKLSFDLRKVIDIKGESIFREEYIASLLLASTYFAAKKNDVVSALIPAVFRETYDTISALYKNQAHSASQTIESLQKTNNDIRAEKLLLQLPLAERISMYKTLIRESFAIKKSIFIVLPNERDVKIFSELLSRGIESFSFSIHGGVTPKKIIEQFKKIIESAHPILICGTAQFLSIPRYDIGTIIAESESANGYKMIARPYIDMRVFIEIFANMIQARLILADTMLRFETIGRKDIDNLTEMRPLSFRLNFVGDIEVPAPEKKFKVLTDDNVESIKRAITKGENVFIFALRKGLATMTICRDCAEPLMCKHCGAPVVLYISRGGTQRMFICNRCKREMDADTICPKCGSWNLISLGIGTDTVFEAITQIFKEEKKTVKVFQLDKASAQSKSGAEKIVKDFEQSSGAVLVGTEMALYYLIEPVGLSVIASFDSLWSIPNFKMSEKIIQIIFAILAKTQKKLIVQTKNGDDPVIRSIIEENLLSFVRQDLEDKKRLGYPPYKRFIKITYQGNKEETAEAKRTLQELLREFSPEIFSGFIAQMKDKYITHALLKIDIKKWSLSQISLGAMIDKVLLAKLSSLPPAFSINVDPEDLL